MPLSADDFTRLGSAAADALASKGTPLAETIDKMASDNGMSLEQIKRLCEASNNASFKAFFDASAPTDRQATFKVAAAEDVIALRRMKSSNAEAKTASAPFDAAHELRPLSRTGYVPGNSAFDAASGAFSKTAAAAEPWVDPVEKAYLEKLASQQAFERQGQARLMREHLESVSATARYKYASAVEEIATHFRRLGPDWAPAELDAFEKNAMAQYGTRALPVLREVRNTLPYGPLKYALPDAMFHVPTPQSGALTTKIASAITELERSVKAGAILSEPGGIEAALESASKSV